MDVMAVCKKFDWKPAMIALNRHYALSVMSEMSYWLLGKDRLELAEMSSLIVHHEIGVLHFAHWKGDMAVG